MALGESVDMKEILAIASPLIKGMIDKLIIPKIEKLKTRYDMNVIRKIPTPEHFQEYFYRTYKKLSVINTLVFNNSQKYIKDIYIPLTLRLSNEREVTFKIESYPHEIAAKYQKILITDSAGMGKSTLMKRIFLDIIDSKKGIPILIELRRLSKEKSILDEVYEQLNAINSTFLKELLLELLIDGEFVFILDGFDEISISDREYVTKDIQNFISKASLNYFFLTSRPESALKSFGDFREFTIEPLKKKEAFELLRKYDNQGAVSGLLIKKLQEVAMSNIEEFLTNPLLVSLLFTAFEYRQVIPFKKHIFYRQVYDANFESHDLTKGDSYMHKKYCGLDIDDFHRVLRVIGFRCLKLQKIEFTKDEFLLIINEAQSFCVGIKFSPSDFMKDLLTTVPLFVQDGIYYKWSHKSLQEYFAAQFIYLDSKEKQKGILEKIYTSVEIDKFLNILDLYYDIDYKMFRNIFIYNLACEYYEHNKNNYTSIYPEVNDKSVLERKELSFLGSIFFFAESNLDEGKNIRQELLAPMMKKMREDYNLESHSLDGVFYIDDPSTVNSQLLLAARYSVEKCKILSILGAKKDKFVSQIKYSRDADKNGIKIEFQEEYVPLMLTDDPNSILNSKQNFSQVNNQLKRTSFREYKINHTIALKMKSEIAMDLQMEGQSDFLLDGI